MQMDMHMTSQATSPSMSPQAIRLFQETCRRVRTPPTHLKLWTTRLSDSDKCKAGGSLRMAFQNRDTIDLWVEPKGVSPDRAVVDLGLTLGFLTSADHRFLLSELQEDFENTEEGINRALSRHSLVHVEHPRRIFWMGEAVAVNWNQHNRLWVYLSELIIARKRGGITDRFSLNSDDPTALSKCKSRLAKQGDFPLSLSDLIVPAGRGSQYLQVEPEQICLIRPDD